MEANPRQFDDITDQLFDGLVSYSRDLSGSTHFVFTGRLSNGDNVSEVEFELKRALMFMQESLLSFSEIFSDNVKNTVSVAIDVLEPRFSNIMYGFTADASDNNIRSVLYETTYSKSIDVGGLYYCSLKLEDLTGNMYLDWKDGNEILYHFKPYHKRFGLFGYLLANSNMAHSSKELRERSLVPEISTKLHENFTKSFLIGSLRDKFALVSEKQRIGIRDLASFSGAELVSVIRNNLIHLEATKKRRPSLDFKKTVNSVSNR